jgi:hypothetical protein
VDTKPLTWSYASVTDVMPDNFVFNLYNGNGTIDKFVGNAIDPLLITGIDPDFDDNNPSFLRDDVTGEITVGDDILWLTDFDRAEEKGMAIRIELTNSQAVNGVEKLIVLGVKASKDASESKALLEKLFVDHHYSEGGFEIFPQGAPTNNTEEKGSGYSSKDLGAEESFAQERLEPLFTTTTEDFSKKDGQWLAEALGLGTDVFQHVRNSDGEDIISAMHMNQALFQGTLGMFMQVMLKEWFLQANKTTAGINEFRDFFVNYISARGFVPAIRIGKQPYGILTTTAYSKWKSTVSKSIPDYVSYYTKKFDQVWQGIIDQDKVAYIDRDTGNEEAAQKNFLNILGLNPASVAYYLRYGFSSGPSAKIPLILKEVLGNETYWTELQNLIQGVDCLLDRNESLIYKTVFNGGPISGPGNKATHALFPPKKLAPSGGVIDVNPLSRSRGIKQYSASESRNYIEMLLDTSPDNYLQRLRAQLYDDVPNEGNRPNALFYLYAWHGLTMQYFDSSMDLLDTIKSVTVTVAGVYPLSSTAILQYTNTLTTPYAKIKLSAPINKRALEHGAVIYVTGIQSGNLNGAYPIIGVEDFSGNALLVNADELIVGANLFGVGQPAKKPVPTGGNAQVEGIQKGDYGFSTAGNGIIFPRLGLLVRKNLGFLAHTDLTNLAGNNFTGGQIIAPWKYMMNDETGYSDHSGAISPAQYLVENLDNTVYTEESKYLKAVINCLNFLKDKSTDQLEMCFSEHMDLLSYRIDAWKQGLVNHRLRELRKTNPTSGTYIGAYGWVENLKPKSRTAVAAGQLPDGYSVSDGLTLDAANQGYVHAPSIAHANTAAILRSAYFADADQSNPDQMAINLSSKRVRRALWYLDGVRNGQLLAAMLGYQFERALHDKNIAANAYITDIRNEYPLVAPAADAVGVSIESVEARNVINGATLIREITENGVTYPYGVTTLPNSGPERTAIEEAVDQILDDMDAISDLGLAESVFHISQGNYDRGKAAMDAVSSGGRPPEIEIVNTPRSGNLLTNKVGVLLNEAALPGTSARSIADPFVNDWLAQMFGALSDIRCKVDYLDTLGVAQATEVALSELNLEAIDLVYLLKDTPKNDGSDLAVRLRNRVISAQIDVDPASIQLKFDSVDPAWGMGVRTLMETSLLAQKLHETLGSSRPVFDDDFSPPSIPSANPANPKGIDILEYESRCRTALGVDVAGTITGGLAQVSYNISDIPVNSGVYPTEQDQIDAFKLALNSALEYGLVGSIAPLPTGVLADDLTAIKAKADQLLPEINTRIAQALAALDYSTNLSIEKQYEHILEAFQALFGKSFKPAPRFNLSNAAELTEARSLTRSESLLNFATAAVGYDVMEYPVLVEDWLFGVSKVRAKIAREETIRTLLDNFGVNLSYTPMQFPVEADPLTNPEHWLATEYPEDYGVKQDTVCLAMQMVTGTTTFGELSSDLYVGLMFDEWNETIPFKEENTGIAFHYDQPNAKAPNALLLAVSPVQTGKWTFDNLLDTVSETFEMMKKRAVEPDHIDETALAHLLPAAMSWVSNDPRKINLDPGVNIGKPFPGTTIPYIETSNYLGGEDYKPATTIGQLLDYEYKFNNQDPISTSPVIYPASNQQNQ